MKAFKTMFGVELRLNVRDMNMVVFAIAMPVVVLVILGVLYGGSPAYEGADYSFLEQSFGALCSIAICAGGAMGLPLMVSEYRERKILKRFQATPVRPAVLLLVHAMIYTLYAAVSAVLLWGVSALCFGVRMRGSWLGFLGGWALTLVCMLSIGMLVGGVAKNSKQASVIASVLYFPMLVFSGATLPYEAMPAGLQRAADVMPLTQGIKLMKSAYLGQAVQDSLPAVLILGGVTAVCLALSFRFFRWE